MGFNSAFKGLSEVSLSASRIAGKLTTADGLYMETVYTKFRPDQSI